MEICHQFEGRSMLNKDAFWKALQTESLGRSFRFLDVTDSTSNQVRKDALAGAPHGHLVTAEIQREGRGRNGRTWVAPGGVNLSFSLLLRPKMAISQVPSLTLCAAVGCREAIADTLENEGKLIGIKWPNDLIFGEKKLCGILSEMALTNRGELDFVIIGIGINVNLSPSDLPPPLNQTATSLLAIGGKSLDRSRLLATVTNRLEKAFRFGFCPSVAKSYRQSSCTLGTAVRVIMENETIEGVAADFTSSGALILRTADGQRRKILAGDVEHLRPLK